MGGTVKVGMGTPARGFDDCKTELHLLRLLRLQGIVHLSHLVCG
jgi:hypothetical protein